MTLDLVPETDDPNAILCAYPVNNCVMKFTYSELASGKSNLTVLKEPGWSFLEVPFNSTGSLGRGNGLLGSPVGCGRASFSGCTKVQVSI